MKSDGTFRTVDLHYFRVENDSNTRMESDGTIMMESNSSIKMESNKVDFKTQSFTLPIVFGDLGVDQN